MQREITLSLIEPAKELTNTTKTGISKPLSQPLLKFKVHIFYKVRLKIEQQFSTFSCHNTLVE